MSIFKRGRVYWFHFTWNGQHVQQSTKQKNANVARTIEAAFRTSLAKGDVGIVERKNIPTFKNALADFLKWSETAHQAHSATFRRYRVSAAALRRHIADIRLDKITSGDVEAFKTLRRGQVSARTGRQIKPATVNRELACLKAMFNHVLKADLPIRNPVSKVKFCEENNEQTRTLSYAEQQLYLAKATPTLADVATLMLETGMRPEEVYRIRRSNVHLREHYLMNPFGKTKAAKTPGASYGSRTERPQAQDGRRCRCFHLPVRDRSNQADPESQQRSRPSGT